jgi:hypothetical protein
MRILNLQLNRHYHISWQLLYLDEAGVVHLLRLDVVLKERLLQAGLVHLLDVVIEELLPLGGHLVVDIPRGLLLLSSKLVQLLHALPSPGRQTLGWKTLGCPDTCGHTRLTEASDDIIYLGGRFS